jgi:hypothetical protein
MERKMLAGLLYLAGGLAAFGLWALAVMAAGWL